MTEQELIASALALLGESAPPLATKLYGDHIAVVAADGRKHTLPLTQLLAPVPPRDLLPPLPLPEESLTRTTTTPPGAPLATHTQEATVAIPSLRTLLEGAISPKRVALIEQLCPIDHLPARYHQDPDALTTALLTLDGIGPATAERVCQIIDHHG